VRFRPALYKRFRTGKGTGSPIPRELSRALLQEAAWHVERGGAFGSTARATSASALLIRLENLLDGGSRDARTYLTATTKTV